MKKWLFLLLLIPVVLYFRTFEPVVFSGIAMTVPYRILVGHNLNDTEKKQIDRAISAIFKETHEIYNKFNPDSELSKINASKTDEWLPLSPKLFTLLDLTDKMYQQTEHKFDPTAASFIHGWSTIQLAENQFYKSGEILIDLGGIAKGYTIDLIVEKLNSMGYRNLLVEWGGDFRATGRHPERRPWTVAITFPEQGTIDTVELDNCSLATSGDYLQNWTIDGETYFHIYDPDTAKPLKMKPGGIRSTSVQAKTALEADAFATALMLFNTTDEATHWIEQQGVANWWLVQ